ncbi:DUF5325 family protein [Litoribacterium kuwaitense]|uniref:DUF5325 family protein n=1 Tax=Litoribacterium kuwaitense TaxID=1398745 RepID=UPI0028A7A0D5|nr:DUF5325 family protein [Litoribacterium kuwaitense]
MKTSVKLKYFLLALLSALSISMIGVAIGLSSWPIGIAAILAVIVLMGVGFSQKAKDRRLGRL